MGFDATLPLLHSLGWLTALMFAAVWPSLPGGISRRHAGWLIGFCATRLLAAAQTLVVSVAPETRQLGLTLSGVLLWEFARRVWNDGAGRKISAATHLLAVETIALAAAVATGGGGRTGRFLPLDLVDTLLPGALGGGAAWLLWRRFAAEPGEPRRAALRFAVVGLGLFAIPGGIFSAAWDALPPWLAAAGLGLACFTLPAIRTRDVIACAAGVALIAMVGPLAVSVSQRNPDANVSTDLLGRVARASAPLQGRFATLLAAGRIDPGTGESLRQYLEKLHAADPLVHAANLWQPRDGRLHAADFHTGNFVDARAASAEEQAGFARAEAFFVPADSARSRLFATVWAPLSPGAFETPTAWLALEFPEIFWTAQRQHARQLGITLVGVLAAFCAMGFVLVVRQRLEAARQLDLERTQAADRAKTEFLAFLGHELRTPLQTILGRAELLHQLPGGNEPVERAAARHAAAIEAQGRLLLRLVTDLLDLGTIEAGHFRLQPAAFALRPTLAAVEDTVRASAAAKQLGLIVAVDPAVPDALVGDEARLRQILGNLLGNAVKYTARGEVRLDVTLQSMDNVAALNFRVRDTGPGLPVEKIPRLFTLFSRLDAGDTFTREGTGVGLALVRRLCTLMGGEVSAGNRPEGGAEFTVRLKLPLAATATSAAPAALPPVVDAPLSVLVAEDNTAARELLAEALRALGHDVAAVADGPSALAAATARSFDTVLLDINLPGLDGVKVARQLRARQTAARIVACSAEALPAVREAALAAGCDDFLVKPVTLATLGVAIAPAASATPTNLFARLGSPAAIAQTRALLCREWPHLRTETEAAIAAGDAAAPRRLAHYLQSSALLLADETLLGLCRRLSGFSAANLGDNPRAPFDEIEHHFAAWPALPASPSSATTRPT